MKLYRDMKARNAHRLVWHAQSSKDKWAMLLQRIDAEWMELELKSVLEGVRPCALTPLTKEQYMTTLPWAMNNGLKVRLVRMVKRFDGFANFYEAGDDYYVTALARDNDSLQNPEANLGYPDCCQKFFASVYPTVCDPIWQWAVGDNRPDSNEVTVIASPYSDPTLRYNSIRFAPHIPCNPQCGGSIDLGQKFAALMNPELRDARLELFNQPRSWDCYRTIAIIKTAVMRMVVGSVPAAERYVVNVVAG